MVDRSILARKIAAVRDAVERIREVLPEDAGAFEHDRTAREVVTLNLFVALQEAIDLAAHVVSDAGWGVPEGFKDIFDVLAAHGILPPELARRLRQATGFRNIVAHRYAVLDPHRVFEIASRDLGDLEAFCAELAKRA